MSTDIKFSDDTIIQTLEDIFKYTSGTTGTKETFWVTGGQQCDRYCNRSIDDIVKLAFYYFPDIEPEEVLKSLINWLYKENLKKYPEGLYDEDSNSYSAFLDGIILCPDIDRFVTVCQWSVPKKMLDIHTYGGVFFKYSNIFLDPYDNIDDFPYDSDLFSISDLLECIYNELTKEEYIGKLGLELEKPIIWYENLQEQLMEDYD